MKTAAHRGLYIAENIVKRARVGGVFWGIIDAAPNGVYYKNTFFLTLASCFGTGALGGWRTHVHASVNETSPLYTGGNYFYQSGDGSTAARFSFSVNDGTYKTESGFDGKELSNPFRDIISDSSRGTDVFVFASYDPNYLSFDFVVSAYANAGLGVNILTLPLRTTPAAFTAGKIAVFEFQTPQLIEL